MCIFDDATLATAAAAAVMSNAIASCAASRNRPASYNSPAPHDRATSDNRATAVNSTAIISASTILVIRIAVRTAIISTSDECSPPNHGSAAINRGSVVNCNASVNRTSAVAANGPDFHKLAVVHWRCENAFGTRNGRAYRRSRKHHQADYSSNEQLDCQIGHKIRSFSARVNLPLGQRRNGPACSCYWKSGLRLFRSAAGRSSARGENALYGRC